MAGIGGSTGNRHSTKDKREWANAIRRAVARGKNLNRLADKLIEKALEGDMVAMKEFGDRYEGKPQQVIAGPGDAGEHRHKITVEIVDVKD